MCGLICILQVRGMMNQGYGMMPNPAYMDPHAQGYIHMTPPRQQDPYDPAHFYANGSPFQQEQPEAYYYNAGRQFQPQQAQQAQGGYSGQSSPAHYGSPSGYPSSADQRAPFRLHADSDASRSQSNTPKNVIQQLEGSSDHRIQRPSAREASSSSPSVARPVPASKPVPAARTNLHAQRGESRTPQR